MKNLILISFIFGAFIFQINSLDLEKIRSDILTDHNYYRKKHQVDELQRSAEIEKVAQAYSEHLAKIEQKIYSGNDKYGENLYYCWDNNSICVTKENVSQTWYDEVKLYDLKNPRFISGTGDFTQLVWKGSKEIGCGAACNNKNKCYVTCNYYPPGNYLNQIEDNIIAIKEGMSTAGKAFLGIFIIILILLIAFSIFHFVVKKRRFGEIKNYFVKNTN